MTDFTAAEAAEFYGPEWYEDAFDYEYLPTCQFPVADPHSPEGESDCDKPAVAYGWWGASAKDYDGGWRLCQEHLDKIVSTEQNREVTS